MAYRERLAVELGKRQIIEDAYATGQKRAARVLRQLEDKADVDTQSGDPSVGRKILVNLLEVANQ